MAYSSIIIKTYCGILRTSLGKKRTHKENWHTAQHLNENRLRCTKNNTHDLARNYDRHFSSSSTKTETHLKRSFTIKKSSWQYSNHENDWNRTKHNKTKVTKTVSQIAQNTFWHIRSMERTPTQRRKLAHWPHKTITRVFHNIVKFD